MPRNRSFEDLCVLASREQWCWRIPCTTCGNQDIRLALRELAEGRLSEEWWSLANNRPTLQRRLRHLDAYQPWPLTVQQALIGKITCAQLADIARDGRFPDWLGILGVTLLLTQDAESPDRVLTAAWGQQLLTLLPERARSGSRLASVVWDHSAILTWRNLEEVEQAIRAGMLLAGNYETRAI